MSKNKKKEESKTFLDQEIDLQEQYSKAEHFIEDNKGVIFAALGALALLLIIVFGFRNVYLPGQESEAQEAMYTAERYFAQDSFALALNGDGGSSGFLDVIHSYSGYTNSVNLANYYAGICFLQTGDYDSAIEYLGNFKAKDKMLGAMALGAMGDAYLEKGDAAQALSQYQKAADKFDNEFTRPLYLFKAGSLLEKDGKSAEAKALYEKIKSAYPEKAQSMDIEKYIARAEMGM